MTESIIIIIHEIWGNVFLSWLIVGTRKQLHNCWKNYCIEIPLWQRWTLHSKHIHFVVWNNSVSWTPKCTITFFEGCKFRKQEVHGFMEINSWFCSGRRAGFRQKLILNFAISGIKTESSVKFAKFIALEKSTFRRRPVLPKSCVRRQYFYSPNCGCDSPPETSSEIIGERNLAVTLSFSSISTSPVTFSGIFLTTRWTSSRALLIFVGQSKIAL